MDIADAVAAANDIVLENEDDEALAEVIKQVYASNQISHNDQVLNATALFFRAGRVFQADEDALVVNPKVELSVGQDMLNEFLEFLSQKLEAQ
jgi:hypothetical protein